ncbi:MAG: DUF4357 domain-containing protein [Alphaproteobacteria bacterium]
MREETIRIFLPDGNPKGVREADISGHPVEIILMPKIEIKNNKNKLDFLGCYILVDTLTAEKPEIYIGEGKVKERVSQHITAKPFWNYLFAIRLKDEAGFNKAQISHLERELIKYAKKVNQSNLMENKQEPVKYPMDKHESGLLKKFLDDIEILLPCLGLKILQPLSEGKKADILTIKNKQGFNASAEEVEDGFLVHKGAIARLDHTPSFVGTSEYRYRQRLLDDGILKQENSVLVLQEDHKFSSPSNAAGVILGASVNGLNYWINSKGQTLTDIYKAEK